MLESQIEILFTGTDVFPGSVRSKDLAELIASVEDMIASRIVEERPDLTKDDVVVGLVNLAPGSIRLQFSPQMAGLAMPAYESIAASVRREQYADLPKGSIDSLKSIASFARKYNGNAELRSLDGQPRTLAVVTPSTDIPAPPTIQGQTTLYGKVIRVGGRTPKLMVEAIDGSTVYPSVTEDVARQLGQKLYSWVGLYGTATWSAEDLTLEDFYVTGVTTYERRPASEAMKELSELVRDCFADVDDVEEYVSRLRR